MTAPAAVQVQPARRTAGSGQLVGTGPLLRLALRRDRIMMPVWVLVTGGLVTSGTGSIEQFYDTAAKRADLVRSVAANGSLRAMYGPVFDNSVGGVVAWRFGGIGAVLAAVMSLMIVVRHTREEEESGRQELLSSGMVGRRAPLTAALLAALVANALLALLVTAGLSGEGAAGALALGLSVGGIGMLFAGMAAITAQVTESARLARGLAAAVLGLAFVLRAAGDASTDGGSSLLTWLSPLGWAENVRPYSVERWWVVLLITAAVLAQGAVAYFLTGRRDVGMSFLPARPGPAHGSLTSAGGLAGRLQRGSVLGWGAGFLLAGVVFGGMADGAADLVGDNKGTRDIIERMGGQSGLTDAFLAAMTGLLGMAAALYAVQSVLRLHGEETSGRAEPVLAGAVGRLRWAAGHLVIAFGGATLIVLLGGLGLAVGHGAEFGPLLGASLVQLPAVWVLGGIAVLLYGVVPKAAVVAWAAAGGALALGWIGPALSVPQSVLDFSPFGHLPKLPGGELAWTPVLTLTAIAAALVAAGLAGLRRRDLLS
jgi:ABC-2 type transport system permease protein